MDVRRGELWLVNFDPAVGHEIKKSRPAVIIQNNIGNRYSSVTIVAPVTSKNIEKIYPVEVALTPKNSTVDQDSKVLLNQIKAIDKERLIRKLGEVNEETVEKINEALKISLGLIPLL